MQILEAIFSNPIIAFIILVGVVVFVHELGHYLVGRAVGIDVEEFSLGFGPRAVGFKRGNTDYRISWLPLGGYVRFYGSELGMDIPVERRERSITTAKLYKRFLVSIAGPGANFVLSFLVMVVLSSVGLPQPAPVVSVMPGSVAEKAGFEDGDLIKKIDGNEIRTWGDFNKVVSTSAEKNLAFEIEREGATVQINVTPASDESQTPFGESIRVGRIGVTQFMLTPRVAVVAGSPFAVAGMKSGDLITAVNGKPVRYFHQVEKMFAGATFPLKVSVDRIEGATPENVDDKNAAVQKVEIVLNEAPAHKVFSTDLTVSGFDTLKRNDKRVAALDALKECGFVAGHTISGVADTLNLRSPVQLGVALEKIQKAAGTANNVTVPFELLSWDGAVVRKDCVLPLRAGKDALSRDQVFLDFPVKFVTHGLNVEPVTIKSRGLAAFRDGARAAGEQAVTIFTGIKKLVTGNVPLANLGGPIAIARVAGDAAQGGLLIFVLTISWMSINIGMFNLLPLPALDGGTILLQIVEGAYGKPLPLKVQEGVQRVGILIILTLIVLVFYNDILRLFHA